MRHLQLQQNSFTGSIPHALSNLSQLQIFQVDSNRLTGTVPSELLTLSMLQYAALNNNQLRGQINGLSASLKLLTLHANSFTGVLPSFALLHNLQDLTLFGNHFRGSLILPESASMSTMFAHDNRLSCKISAHNTTVNSTQNLAAPGNAFSQSSTSLSWMRMEPTPPPRVVSLG